MRSLSWLCCCLLSMLSVLVMVGRISAQSLDHPAPVAPVENPCPRPAAGSVVERESALYARSGELRVRFSYQSRRDEAGRVLYCFMTPDGKQNPTLHLRPGDHLLITLTNNLPAGSGAMAISGPICGAAIMDSSSVNIHFHGGNISPTCHQDEVIKTMVNSGQTFRYDMKIPANEPPGLYWYHTHIHGLSESMLQGGAAGAIVVEGIENVQPVVAGLRQRVLVVRDQLVPGAPSPGGDIPSWDVSLNYVPITSPSAESPHFVPAVLLMQGGEKQFWRVANASADTILDLRYLWDGKAQTMQLVARDGVPIDSQDGKRTGESIGLGHILLPPAARAEFIVEAPPQGVKLAQLVTQNIDTGPLGDNDPTRPLATIRTGDAFALQAEADAADRLPAFSGASTGQQRFAGLAQAPLAKVRTVYFDEIQPTAFFMAVEGRPKHVFDPSLPPDIVARQGTVEQWVIQNRTMENHEFHIHQIHFLIESQDNFEINGSPQPPGIAGQYLDMVQVPYWDGNPQHPYPSVKVRMDFRGPDVGDFVFHCHILQHEDLGMMNIIRVVPRGSPGEGR
ncbi:multicopper oxidase family protein [Dyella choica]|uniref:Copper oxidase n=1 Tax=Dyella choica TaxID=1927959 RepID=A0A3S0WWA6_9GAMM|nr:multicopper oxidase domain-containing protein [Dyella choica]RUL76132.1 copper oxidase [Dyella choica]